MVNRGDGLRTVDCATWTLVPAGPAGLAGVSHGLVDKGLAVVGPDKVTFLRPDLTVEREVTYRGTGEASANQSTVDPQDNVWLLRDGACGTASTLTVVTRGGKTASYLLSDGTWLTSGADGCTVTTGPVPYLGTLTSDENGAYLVESRGYPLAIRNPTTSEQTSVSQCDNICTSKLLTPNRCTAFSGADFDMYDDPEHCFGLCLGQFTAAYRQCLATAGSDCAAAAACTPEYNPHPRAVLWPWRLTLAAGPAIGFEPLPPLSTWARNSGGYFGRMMVGTARSPVASSTARGGLMTYALHHVARTQAADDSTGWVELWNPQTRARRKQTPEMNTQGTTQLLNYVVATPNQIYWYLTDPQATSVGGVSGPNGLVVSDLVGTHRVQDLPPIFSHAAVVESTVTGHYFAFTRTGTGPYQVQLFDKGGTPIAGSGGGSLPPRCTGSRFFTRLGDPCYLDALIDPGYQCASDSTSRTSYRCDATTCTFIGSVCGPCGTSCLGCSTGTCP